MCHDFFLYIPSIYEVVRRAEVHECECGHSRLSFHFMTQLHVNLKKKMSISEGEKKKNLHYTTRYAALRLYVASVDIDTH